MGENIHDASYLAFKIMDYLFNFHQSENLVKMKCESMFGAKIWIFPVN